MPRVFHSRLLVLLLAVLALGADTKIPRKWVDYDRMSAVQDFLVAVYPDLRTEKGILTFRTMEFNILGSEINVSFVQCRPGSGVPAGGFYPGMPPLHTCNFAYETSHSQFLELTVVMGPHDAPIRHFEASGEFVAGKLESFRKEVKAHPDWQEKDILAALAASQAKFGPEQRDQFLRAIPSTMIAKYSGCRLDLNKAKFMGGESNWLIPGTARRGKESVPCNVKFEPFEGKLLSIDEL
jgi:hypothetical protein